MAQLPYQARTAASTAYCLRAPAQGGQNKLGHAPNTPAANESETMSHWENDKLNRQLDAEIIIDTARKIHDEGVVTGKNGLVMAINAPWGGGKSYLLDGIAENLGHAGCKVLRFNAWENDYSKDALSSFLAEMGDQIESLFGTGNDTVTAFKKSAKRIAWDVSKVFFAAALKKLSGAAIDDIIEAINGDNGKIGEGASPDITKDLFTQHKDLKEQVALLRKSLSALYCNQEGGAKPIFILIDELDRCRPNFSIELLEAVKHIFQVDGICFLIAVNKEQLMQSIKVTYGASFNSFEYLHRFFDVEYKLKTENSTDLWSMLLDRYKIKESNLLLPYHEKPIEYLRDLALSFKLTLRDVEQVCFKIYLLKTKINDELGNLHIGCLAPLLFAQQKGIKLDFLANGRAEFQIALTSKEYDESTKEFFNIRQSNIPGSPSLQLFLEYKNGAHTSRLYGEQVKQNTVPDEDISYENYSNEVNKLGDITAA